jgi:hypothetical protein
MFTSLQPRQTIPSSFFLFLFDSFLLELLPHDHQLKFLPDFLLNSGIPDRIGSISVGFVFVVGQIFAFEFDERFFEFRSLTMISLKEGKIS